MTSGKSLKCPFQMGKLPKPHNKDVDDFIEAWGNLLDENQLNLLKLFSANIYEFKKDSHTMQPLPMSRRGNKFTAVFRFVHIGIKGKIKLEF